MGRDSIIDRVEPFLFFPLVVFISCSFELGDIIESLSRRGTNSVDKFLLVPGSKGIWMDSDVLCSVSRGGVFI